MNKGEFVVYNSQGGSQLSSGLNEDDEAAMRDQDVDNFSEVVPFKPNKPRYNDYSDVGVQDYATEL